MIKDMILFFTLLQPGRVGERERKMMRFSTQYNKQKDMLKNTTYGKKPFSFNYVFFKLFSVSSIKITECSYSSIIFCQLAVHAVYTIDRKKYGQRNPIHFHCKKIKAKCQRYGSWYIAPMTSFSAKVSRVSKVSRFRPHSTRMLPHPFLITLNIYHIREYICINVNTKIVCTL